VDGKIVPTFASVSRIRRHGIELEGYQRPEVHAHIQEIRDYIDGENPLIPNAIVIAFDSSVRFEPSTSSPDSPWSRMGTLVIPIDDDTSKEDKPGFVVDGQQRLAAIRDARRESFPICVTAFITNDLKQQTEQFILVNSTKPLPKGLIYELLPSTTATLPGRLRKRRLPAYLLDRLNRDTGSPLAGLIQTPTMPEGIIKDNSILKMLENSLTDGVLYRLRAEDQEKALDDMLGVLRAYWHAVRDVFKEDWGLPPRRSRLMHGAGIVSMGFVMDAIAERHRDRGVPNVALFSRDLAPLKKVCKWTNGAWRFSDSEQRKWNEVQNTSKDIQMLSRLLVTEYRHR
jgi:DGQHR domain-containing protein